MGSKINSRKAEIAFTYHLTQMFLICSHEQTEAQPSLYLKFCQTSLNLESLREGAKFIGPQHWKLEILSPEKSLGPVIFFSQKSSSPVIFFS